MIFVEVSQLEIKSGRVSSRNPENGLARSEWSLAAIVAHRINEVYVAELALRFRPCRLGVL